jgi:hypothetical protein
MLLSVFLFFSSTMSCCFITKSRGERCKFSGKHQYGTDGKMYCKRHYTFLTSREECCICLNEMTETKKRFRLACGHYFHIDCLSQCGKAECPLCRSAFLPEEACEIFRETIIMPIARDLFSVSGQSQAYTIHSMRTINSVVQRGEWFASTMYQVVTGFQKNMDDTQLLYDAVNNFLMTLQH